MAPDRTGAVEALLEATMDAHGTFEEKHLKGAHDKKWAQWYAEYVVKHGMCNVVGNALTTDQLANFLAATKDEFELLEPTPTEPWATYTARRITTELSPRHHHSEARKAPKTVEGETDVTTPSYG